MSSDKRPLIFGIAVVGVLAGAIFMGWAWYSDFLYQGARPPESTQILNKIENEGAPDFTLNGRDGKPITLSNFQGKVVLLNFWASWCEPCIKEFPSMLQLIEHFKGEVILLAISADYEEQDMENFLKAFKADSPHLRVAWDKDQQVARSYGTFTLPESYILGRDGKLIRKISGIEEWYTKDAIAYFEKLTQDDKR